MTQIQIAIAYPNGAFMVYALDKPADDIARECDSYNYRRPRDSLARVVRVEVVELGGWP